MNGFLGIRGFSTSNISPTSSKTSHTRSSPIHIDIDTPRHSHLFTRHPPSDFISKLPINDHPEAFGLHENAEFSLSVRETYGLLAKAQSLQQVLIEQ